MPAPRSSSRIQPATLSRKYRSCVTATTVPGYSARCRSSHATDSASRWLVGSSRRRRSGFSRRILQSATRRFSPPEIFVTSASGGGRRSASIAISSCRSSSQALDASMASWTRWYSAMTFSLSASESSSASFSFSSSNRFRSARVLATASSTLPRTSFEVSSLGSCGRKPIRVPSAGNASPAKSLSTPAMIRRSVDLPAPFKSEDADLGAGEERELDALEDLALRRHDLPQVDHRVDVLVRHRAGESIPAGSGLESVPVRRPMERRAPPPSAAASR